MQLLNQRLEFHSMHMGLLDVMLAENDRDDRFLFGKVLKNMPNTGHVTLIPDGKQLMNYLSKNSDHLPDLLFLDVELHKKTGFECLYEIKDDERLKDIPVVMLSTSFAQDRKYEAYLINMLLKIGALHFIHKSDDFGQIRAEIQKAFAMSVKNNLLTECMEIYS